MAKLAPDFREQSSLSLMRQAQALQQQDNREQQERAKWDYVADLAQDVKGKAQGAVNQSINSNMLKNSIPQGKFVVQGDDVEWVWNKNASVTKLPSMDESWDKYKRAKTLTGQVPNFAEFYPMYNNMNAGYAQAMDSKFKNLEGLGFTPEDVKTALTDNNLLANLSQVSGTSVQGPKGQMIPVGAGIGPYLKEVVGKKDKGFWDYREELWSPLGMDTFKGGGLAYGAIKGGKKVATEVVPKVKGKVAQKLAERQIAQRGLIPKHSVTSPKVRSKFTPQKVVGDLVKYFKSNSSDDLIKLITKKGFGKAAAAKLAARITAVSAAATLGTATAPATGGLSAIAGYGMAAWGLYDVWTILSEIAPDIQEAVYGDVPKAEF